MTVITLCQAIWRPALEVVSALMVQGPLGGRNLSEMARPFKGK